MPDDLVDDVLQLIRSLPTQRDDPGSPYASERTSLALWLVRSLRALDRLAEALEILTMLSDVKDVARAPELAREALEIAARYATDDEERTRSETKVALSLAESLAPALAAPALAKHALRSGSQPDALHWAGEAVRLNPQDAECRLWLAQMYATAGRPDAALATYLDLTELSPSLRSYQLVAQRIAALMPDLPAEQPQQRLRLALVGNATLDYLASYTRVECFRAGFRPEIYQAGFDQYSQELLDPGSGLIASNPMS